MSGSSFPSALISSGSSSAVAIIDDIAGTMTRTWALLITSVRLGKKSTIGVLAIKPERSDFGGRA
jgi:hypothetical protein